MKTLDTLIKLKKKELDELRVRMGNLEQKKNHLKEAKDSINRNIDNQIKFLENRPELSHDFASFSLRTKLSIDGIDLQIKKINNEIEELREIIFEMFGELKRFEIAKDINIKREELKEKHKQDIILNEIGINSFLRKKEYE